MKNNRSLAPKLSALFAGLLFGIGLLLAGMTNPSKVTAFLDLFGRWDPSLAFVMVGAIGVHALLRRPIVRLRNPLFSSTFHRPQKTAIDARLIAGAALFGVGWGLGGVCPGPAFVNVATGSTAALAFVAAMAAGSLIEGRLFER